MLTLASSRTPPPRDLRPIARVRACGRLLAFLAPLAVGGACAPRPPVQTPPPAAAPAPKPAGPPLLTAGQAVAGTAKAGTPARFRVEAGAGWRIELEVDAPPPLDLRVVDAAGSEVARTEVRAPGWPPRRLLFLTPAAAPETPGEGSWTVEAAAPGTGAETPFRLTARSLGPAEAGDGERIEAEKALAEAENLALRDDPAPLRQALERMETARGLWEKAGDGEGGARALLGLAALQLRLGAPGEARALAAKGAEAARGKGDDAEARALTLLGAAALEGGDLPAAREALDRALPLWRATRTPGSTASAAGLGRALLALGRAESGAEPARAEGRLKEAAEPLRRAGDGEGEALALAALEPPLAALGRTEEGEKALLEALRRSRAGGFRAAEAAIQARLAPLRRGRGDLRGAQAAYRRAFELERDLGRTQGALLALLALCAVQRDLGDDEAARACYSQASDEGRRLGARGLEGESLAEQAEVALRQGRPKDASTLLDRLAPLLRALPPEEGGALPARALLDAGIAKRNAGRPKEALADLQGALDLLAARNAPPAPRAQALIQLAATRQRLGDLDGAEAAYRQAAELAPGSGLEGERRRALYGLATVAFARKDLPGSRTLVQEVLALDPKAGEVAPWERSLNPPDAGRHAFYELEVELLMRLHYDEPGAGYAELAFRAAQTARGLETGRPAAALSEIAARLTEEQALLHYFVGEERSYLFVVTRLGLKSFEVPIRGRELAAKIQRLRSTLAQPQATPRPFLMDAVPLFEVLLGPAESFLAGKRQLVVAAEGPLLTLPFEALPTDAKASRDRGFADLPYLLRDRAVSYRPVYGLPEPPPPPPQGEGAPAFVALAAPLPKGIAPPPARYREEVEEIAGRYAAGAKGGVEIYLGSEATEGKAVANPRFSAARRLHLAVPALFDSSQPERSALALTPIDASDEGSLEAAEIAGLRLAAETVVLPLCRTVRGREVGGEGGIALVAAFRRAGAGTVVLGLWTVPEAAGSNLLPKFYELLDAGETPAEALREAKLSLLQSGGADPISWAPFLLFD